jgi:subtilisin family serine protease
MLSPAKIRLACAALLVSLMTTIGVVKAPAQSGWKQIIVRCSPQDLDKIRAKIGAAVLDSYRGHYLLNVASTTNTDDVEGIQRNSIAAVDNKNVEIERGSRGNSGSRGNTRFRTQVVNYYGTLAPQTYTDQPAASKISLNRALSTATGVGARIAVIDTGIDFRHPTLKGVILPGRNYVGRTPVPTEFDDPVLLTQVGGAEFDLMQVGGAEFDLMQVGGAEFDLMQVGGAEFDLMQVGGAEFDLMRAAAAKLLSVGPLFGHGTMTAGLIHLVAPNARIIPMKAFDAAGNATEWNVIRAVLDSIDMGADAINMSFASSKRSKLLDDALDYAASRGLVLVAASGNSDTEAPTYPASEDEVIAVTALDLNDQKASFANFGRYVDLSAPGVDLVTTFPGGMFAMVSGTSESAPLVSGVFGLVRERGTRGLSARQVVERAVDEIDPPQKYQNKLGKGRINAAKAVR